MEQVIGRLRSIQVGMPRAGRTDEEEPRPWTTGIYKASVAGPIPLGRINLRGDGQADLVHHGGPDKAVCAYSADHWPYWRRVLSTETLTGGGFGENFTLEGLTEADLCIGDMVAVGSTLIQVSQPRQPCWKLARRWQILDLALQVEQTGFTGWYFRVLEEGRVEAGQILRLVERPCPEWTIAAANRVMHHDAITWRRPNAWAAVPTSRPAGNRRCNAGVVIEWRPIRKRGGSRTDNRNHRHHPLFRRLS